MHARTGFTLIDSMVTLVVSTLLITVAVPSFNAIYEYIRSDSNIHSIQQSLQLARNHAISYGCRVTACPLVNNACSQDWRIGISVFTDMGQTNVLDADDKIIYQTGAFNTQDYVSYNRPAIHFQAEGLASGTNGTLKYCPGDPMSPYSKAVIINQSGRIRFSQAADIDCSQ